MENVTNGKQQLPCVCCKWKSGTANFRLFAENGNTELCFLWSANHKQYQHVLLQQTCPSMQLGHATWTLTCSMKMHHGLAARKCSMESARLTVPGINPRISPMSRFILRGFSKPSILPTWSFPLPGWCSTSPTTTRPCRPSPASSSWSSSPSSATRVGSWTASGSL